MRYYKLQLCAFHLLVGLSGLEPPTSRLSGVRSNRLSYKPIWLRLQVSLLAFGGDKRDRTVDPLLAKQVLSQLSYTPAECLRCQFAYPLAFARYFLRSAAFLPRSEFLREFQFGLSLLSFLFHCTLHIVHCTLFPGPSKLNNTRHTCNFDLEL